MTFPKFDLIGWCFEFPFSTAADQPHYSARRLAAYNSSIPTYSLGKPYPTVQLRGPRESKPKSIWDERMGEEGPTVEEMEVASLGCPVPSPSASHGLSPQVSYPTLLTNIPGVKSEMWGEIWREAGCRPSSSVLVTPRSAQAARWLCLHLLLTIL